MTRAFIIYGALALAAGAAYADGPGGGKAPADAKYDEGQRLRDAGKLDESCAAFRESLALNPHAIGTQLVVARCDDESGKIGTAVREYTEVRDRAVEQHKPDYQSAAESRLRVLVERVPHLAITFAVPPPPNARLVVDDVDIDLAAAGDVVVDPGSVRVVVSAPDRVAFHTSVLVAEADHKAVSVPALALPVTVNLHKNPLRLIGKIVTYVGAGGFVVGETIALVAYHRWSNATNGCVDYKGELTCPGDNGGTDSNTANAARSLGDVATGVAIGGLVTAAAGGALWFFAPRTVEEHHVVVVPLLAPGTGGVAAAGTF